MSTKILRIRFDGCVLQLQIWSNGIGVAVEGQDSLGYEPELSFDKARQVRDWLTGWVDKERP